MDGDKANNRATNLEWRTNEIAVWQVDRQTGRRIAIYRSIVLAAKAIGGRPNNISACIAGKWRTSYGYKWERASREDVGKHLVSGDN